MTAARFCPQCSKPLSSDAPQGLCPQCLLQAALPGQSALESAPPGLDHSSSSSAVGAEAGTHVKYFGDYQLLEEIARGGMGIVWKARQTSLHRDVALKMIGAGALAGPDEVQRFLREAEAAANLQHPNIVAIHEVGEHDGQHYFSMDYVEGRDLGTLVKDGPLAPQRAARYVKIIAEAIQFAHQRGTLHRDLKPQNVLIDAADQPRITDFGLAKIMKDDSRLTQSGVVMGSPSYMPPEQAAGRIGDIGPASDVYSLGAMLYELLTGRPPFRAATMMATLCEVLEAEPVAPRQLKADIPADLETICLKCLEKAPPARYPTGRALAEELDRFLKGEPILARPASMVRKVVSWGRRHPGTLAAVAALVMVALAFGVFYMFEENAFLRAQQADPSLARFRGPGHESGIGKWKVEKGVLSWVEGPRHESVRLWKTINLCALFTGILTFLAVEVRARRLPFKEWFNTFRDQPIRPPQPLDERTRTLAIGAGLILVGFGVMFLVRSIQAYVWEGESIWEDLLREYFLIYLPVWLGLGILGLVIRDYRLVHYGTSSDTSPRQLTAEQLEAIRRAMENWHLQTAIEVYCKALPDASWTEAKQYTVRLAESLRAQHPGKFVPPPSLTLTNLDWKALLVCALVEIVLLCFLERPSHPAAAVAHFAYSFLFGMALMAFLCVQGFWKGLWLFISAVLVMAVSETILSFSAEEWFRSVWPYLLGVVFGYCLMAFGFAGETGREIRKEPGSK